jgi:hypothetical protein
MAVLNTATDQARTAAEVAKRHPLLEALTRAGFVGYGVVHLLVAWLAWRIAFGRPAGDGDQSGALQTLTRQPFGRVLVIAVAVGLAAMALWQALEALVGHRHERGRTRTAERLMSAGRVLVYTYFAVTAAKVVRGAAASNADSQQAMVSRWMAAPGGRPLVVGLGLALTAVGAGLLWYGATRRFDKHLRHDRMTARVRRLLGRIGTAGYLGKGAAYGIAGVLLVAAAVTYDSDKARGLDGALRTLAAQPFGSVLLTVVALGLATFGIFAILQSRYRDV